MALKSLSRTLLKDYITIRIKTVQRASRRTIMTTFADEKFSHASYASARPSYPPKLYDTVLAYHKGQLDHCLDLGTGHGLVARALAPHFQHVTATDPSPGMLDQARQMATEGSTEYTQRITYEPGTSEEIASSVAGRSVDMVVAGQAAHWFDYDLTWPELYRVMKPGSTMALWGYSDIVFPEHATATRILSSYSYGETALRPYWTLPGRAIVENFYRDIVPSSEYFADLQHVEYVPGTKGQNTGQGELLMSKKSKVRDVMAYVRTWSAVHKWLQANPEEKRERPGDIVDWMFEEIAQHEHDFQDPDQVIPIEWGTGIVLARRK